MKRLGRNGDSTTCYGYVDNPTPAYEFVIIRRKTGEGTERLTVQDRASYEANSVQPRWSNEKKQGPAAVSRQVTSAKRQLRRFCIRHNLYLFFTLTQSKCGTTDVYEFVGMLRSFTSSLTDSGIHPWAATWELTKAGIWHAHVAVSQLPDFKVMNRLWKEAAGARAGAVLHPDMDKAFTYLPEKVAAYLSKDFDKLPNPPGIRVKRFLSSRPLKGERYDKTPRVSYVSARTQEEALVGAVRASQTVDFAWVSRDNKAKRVAFELTDHRTHGPTARDATAEYVKAALYELRKKYWPRG